MSRMASRSLVVCSKAPKRKDALWDSRWGELCHALGDRALF